MKNMAITDLRIVADRSSLNEDQVRTLAVHAADVWEAARFFEPTVAGLKEAMADCAISAGTTRRMGQKRKSWGLTPEQFAAKVAATGASGKTALVFGNERTGLTDEELDCCTVAVNIPSSPDFPSLNLSHAVQLVGYAFFRAFDGHKRGYEPISIARIGEIVAEIGESVDHVGLFRIAGRKENDRFLSEIIARAALSESEARRLERLFRKMAYARGGDRDANSEG